MRYLSRLALNPYRKTLAASLLFFSVAASAPAQDSSSPPPPPAPKIDGDKVTGLNYPDIDIQDLLTIYEKLVDRPVLCDSSVQGNLTLDINIPVSKAEAKRLIEIALLTNSFSVINREKEILILGPGKPTRSASVPIYFESIPEGESVISFVFELKHADPAEIANTLNQYLATGQPYTSFISLPGHRQLLVTETTSTVRLISELIKKIDVEGYKPRPPAPTQADVAPAPPAGAPQIDQTQPGQRRRRVLLPSSQP